VSGTEEAKRLRRALARIMEAQDEALEATDRALELGGESQERLEGVLEDVRDILVGASDDVREILGEDQQAR
jgi:hypothetical protein